MDKQVLEIAHDIHRRVHQNFDYVHDQEQFGITEHWTSHADAVLSNRDFQDDCDGFALTCAELLIKQDLARDRVSLIVCRDETGQMHLVCGVDADYTTWVLDNRFDHVYPWQRRTDYEWMYFMKFDAPGAWFDINDL